MDRQCRYKGSSHKWNGEPETDGCHEELSFTDLEQVVAAL